MCGEQDMIHVCVGNYNIANMQCSSIQCLMRGSIEASKGNSDQALVGSVMVRVQYTVAMHPMNFDAMFPFLVSYQF